MKKVKSIYKLGATLDDLYTGEEQINIHLSDKPFVFRVVLLGRDKKPDCKISSFGANLWARTRKGMDYEKYNTFADLQRSLSKLIKDKVETSGNISYSLSSEVFTF